MVSEPIGQSRSTIGERILTATVELIGEVGLEGLSMRLIAQRARISAPTLYRRWSSKEALVEAAIQGPAALSSPGESTVRGEYCREPRDEHHRDGQGPVRAAPYRAWSPHEGSRRSPERDPDLCAQVAESLAEIVGSPAGRAYSAVMSSARYRRELRDHVRGAYLGRLLAETRLLLYRAIEREEIGPQVDADLLLDMLMGTAEYRCREVGRFDRAFVVDTITELWNSKMLSSVLARPSTVEHWDTNQTVQPGRGRRRDFTDRSIGYGIGRTRNGPHTGAEHDVSDLA